MKAKMKTQTGADEGVKHWLARRTQLGTDTSVRQMARSTGGKLSI